MYILVYVLFCCVCVCMCGVMWCEMSDGGTRTAELARGHINFTRWKMNSYILQFATVMVQNFCE